MKRFIFNNSKQFSLNSIEQRLKIEFKNIVFQYSDSATLSFGSEDRVITSIGSEIIATLDETQEETIKIVSFLNELLAPNYRVLLLEFAKKFKSIKGVTVIETPPSSVTIHINDKPAGGLRLWLNSDKQPHEIEILPNPSEEGELLRKWVIDNQKDILKANVYVAGDLVRMVTVL